MKLDKRGVSPVIATLLLVAIAVAAAVLTYGWVSGMFSTLSGQAQTQIKIESAKFVAGTAQDYINVTIRNTGSATVTVDLIKVKNTNTGVVWDTSVKSASIDPSASSVVPAYILTPGTQWEISTSYTIVASTTSGVSVEQAFKSPSTRS